MHVLGLSGGYGHDPAAALVDGATILASAEEERFTRRKHAFGDVPVHAAAYCLDEAGLTMDDVDCLAIAWQPDHPPPWPTKAHEDLLDHPMFRGWSRPRVEVVSHPLAHAAAAFYTSGLDEAAIVVADGQGDGISTTLAHGTPDGVEMLEQFGIEDSLGYFYWALTTHLGWEWGNEGKAMGLAPYGASPNGPAAFDLSPDGYSARIRVEDHDGHRSRGRATFAAWRRFIEQAHGPAAGVGYRPDPLLQRRRREVVISDRERATAAWGQAQLESVLTHIAELAMSTTGSRNLVVGGGCAYNCSANGRLLQQLRPDGFFVFPASGDAGTSIGAALTVSAADSPIPAGKPLDHAAFGPCFSDDAVSELLRESGVSARRSDDVGADAAALVADRQVIGWFQGRMEIGPRALGQRSILALPTDTGMRDRVNRLKGREPWRPLAPSILADRADLFLDDPRAAPFMLTATRVRDDVRDDFPAMVHVDGSCRPQTVPRDAGTRYARLIAELERQAGVPATLNTSFNIGEEPIVLSPLDAIRAFFASGLDALVIGDSIVEK